MSLVRETLRVGERELSLETGEIARQAGGAVLVRDGDTVLFAVVTAASKPTRLPYMPLTVEYRHRLSAAGRIPGGYERREAKATALEVLVSRVIDRSIRPFFDDGWCYDTQLIVHPLSYDPRTDLEPLAVTAAAAALNISDIPFRVPLAGVRVVRSGGELVAHPSAQQREGTDLDLIVSASPEGIVMLECAAQEVDEETVLAAFALAQEAATPVHEAIERLSAAAAQTPREAEPAHRDETLRARVEELASEKLAAALAEPGKHDRYAAVDAVVSEVLDTVAGDPESEALARSYFDALKKRLIRDGIMAGKRLGGRGPKDIREITGRAGWLPRCHGSSVFTRGETQVMVSCTLADARSAQRIEALTGDVEHRFLLHYDFPPYCVGEVRPLRGPGRREIGHGFLARRALEAVLPSLDEYAFTVRVESTVTESNGSSSMATVCGGSMAMLDAGVPLRRPVAGIAMGLVAEGDEMVVLSDILGDEDHVGDMDFKVAGTTQGITAIQLDNKLGALPLEVMRQGLEQAREGRLHILQRMAEVIAAPRAEPGAYAPRAMAHRIEPARIRDLIGPGGRTINGIRAATGVEIDVADDGAVRLFGPAGSDLAAALSQVEDATGLPKLGETYTGRVVSVKHFGAFVRIFQGIEGLLPDAQPSVGAEIKVRVTGVNPKGKLELQPA